MRVELTDMQRQLRDAVRAFAVERVKPAAAETDRRGCAPRELIAALGELGVMGCFVPERWGGSGFDWVAYALALEELSAACASTASIVCAHGALATWPVLALGSEDQRERYLPRLARGEWLGCLALAEHASADPGSMHTTARREGQHYVLDGTKRFVTNAPAARLAIVFATLDPPRTNRTLAAFIVDTGSPGWEVLRVEEKTGLRGARSAEIRLTAVRVPRANLLGGEDEGFAVATKTRDGGRIAIAAVAVGIARAALEDALAYARQRRAFGRAVADFQAVQFRLADMATAVEAARLLTLRAASLKDQGLPYTREASMAKLHAAETAMALATQAVQMHGGYGYTREFAVERYFRDANVTAVLEGTSEIQHLAIAAQLLQETAA